MNLSSLTMLLVLPWSVVRVSSDWSWLFRLATGWGTSRPCLAMWRIISFWASENNRFWESLLLVTLAKNIVYKGWHECEAHLEDVPMRPDIVSSLLDSEVEVPVIITVELCHWGWSQTIQFGQQRACLILGSFVKIKSQSTIYLNTFKMFGLMISPGFRISPSDILDTQGLVSWTLYCVNYAMLSISQHGIQIVQNQSGFNVCSLVYYYWRRF